MILNILYDDKQEVVGFFLTNYTYYIRLNIGVTISSIDIDNIMKVQRNRTAIVIHYKNDYTTYLYFENQGRLYNRLCAYLLSEVFIIDWVEDIKWKKL